MQNQFLFDCEVVEAVRVEAPLSSAPLHRWQRKALETGVGRISLDVSGNGVGGGGSGVAGGGPRSAPPVRHPVLKSDTPLRSPAVERLMQGSAGGHGAAGQGSRAHSVAAPGRAATERQGGAEVKTRAESKTPVKRGNGKLCARPASSHRANTPQHGDRFIPNRAAMDMEVAHFRINSLPSMPTGGGVSDGGEGTGKEGGEYQRRMSEALAVPTQSHKILAFREQAPSREGVRPQVLCSASATKAKVTRHIPLTSDRILDAPGLIDDFYLNLMAWSSTNLLALALGDALFLWHAGSGQITQLCELGGGPDDYLSAVAWTREGAILALGNSLGAVQIWDVAAQKLLRSMSGHASRVASLSWHEHHLVSGSRSGAIHQHDVRVASHHAGSLVGHTQEVCGLEWSPDGRHVASGANDNTLCVWDSALRPNGGSPLHCFNQHQAAVKALAWCPWQGGLLASGGGTADRHIRFWNVQSGACLQSIDTESQVSALRWSSAYRELVSAHGFAQHQLTLWKYPSMVRHAELLGHTQRVLTLALSPDGSTVASAAADETLRFWKCFEMDEQRRQGGAGGGKQGAVGGGKSVLTHQIR